MEKKALSSKIKGMLKEAVRPRNLVIAGISTVLYGAMFAYITSLFCGILPLPLAILAGAGVTASTFLVSYSVDMAAGLLLWRKFGKGVKETVKETVKNTVSNVFHAYEAGLSSRSSSNQSIVKIMARKTKKTDVELKSVLESEKKPKRKESAGEKVKEKVLKIVVGGCFIAGFFSRSIVAGLKKRTTPQNRVV